MKIGIFVGKVPPPVFINQLVCGLVEAGHKVILYGSSNDKNFQYNNPLLFVRTKPKYKIPLLFNSIFLIFNIIIFCRKNAFSILSQIKNNGFGIRNFLNRCSKVLPPLLDNLDIFHIQWAKTLVRYPEFINNLKCPVVLSLRGAHINYSPLADKDLSQKYKQYFPLISGFHAVSDAIAREAEKYAADPKIITVIRPAVNNSLLKKLPTPIIFNSKQVLKIISVGRCHWKKGYTYALDAMLLLKKSNFNFHYWIIATGIDKEHIKYQISNLGLYENVTLIKGLPHDKTIEMVSRADLFLLPSLEEGISNAVLEAMALGTIVISTNCGGMGEVLENGENGYIIPVRDIDALTKTIQMVSKLPEDEKRKIILNAKQTIQTRHLLPDQIKKFSSLYKGIHSEFSGNG